MRYISFPDFKAELENRRNRTRAVIEAIIHSIETQEFNAPMLIDAHNQIVAAHTRCQGRRANWSDARSRGPPRSFEH
jgi:hypothetical protein